MQAKTKSMHFNFKMQVKITNLKCIAVVCVPLSAVGCVDLTVDAAESYRTAAGVAVDAVGAVPSVSAGGAHTFVHVLCTALTTETSQTHTHKAVHTVLTHTAVTARI